MDMDMILRHALSPKEQPSASINRQILSKMEVCNESLKPTRKRWLGTIFEKSPVAAVLAAAVILAVGGVSAYAAWKYLTPSEVAVSVEDEGLAGAFASEDAVIINKTVSDAGFEVTLLGMVSGRTLSSLPVQQVEFTTIAGQETGARERVKEDSTYCVIAVRQTGEGEGADRDAEFCVSPFIQGQKPWECNIWSMSGGTSSYEENGVSYRILQCDDLEVFANRIVYLGVTDAGSLADGSAYGYNRDTGEISSRAGWPGLNVLFTLPFDQKKADDKKAEKLLGQWQEDAGIGTEENQYVFRHDEWEMEKETAWTVEDVLEKGRLIKGTEQTLTIDAYGLTEEIPSWEYRGIRALAGSYGITGCFYGSDGESVENSWKDSPEQSKAYYAGLSVEKGTAAIVSAAVFERVAGDAGEEVRLFQVLVWNGDGTVAYCAYVA